MVRVATNLWLTRMRRLRQQVTATAGVLFVYDIVNACNSDFLPIPQEHDFGLDALIEFYDGGRPSGHSILAQIKSGPSYRQGEAYRILADRDHFERWAAYGLPIAGIVVDTDKAQAFWVNISRFLANNSGVIESGPYNIPVSASQVLDGTTFYGPFRRAFPYTNRAQLEASADRFVSTNVIERWQGLWELVGTPLRSDRLVPVLLALACTDEDPELRASAADALSCYFAYPEWGSVAPGPFGQWVTRVIARTLTRDSVASLLEVVEEEGFERGPFANAIAEVLRHVPEIGAICLDIAADAARSRHARWWALVLIGYLGEKQAVGQVAQRMRLWTAEGLSEPADWTLWYLGETEAPVAQGPSDVPADELATDADLQPLLPLVE